MSKTTLLQFHIKDDSMKKNIAEVKGYLDFQLEFRLKGEKKWNKLIVHTPIKKENG